MPDTTRAGEAGMPLPEDVLDAVEESSVLAVDRRRLELLLRQHPLQLLEHLLLFLAQLLRRDDLDGHDQIASAAAAHVRHAAPAQTERAARLGALGYLEGLLAIERGDVDLAAQRNGGEVHRNLAVEVVAVTLPERMILHVHDDVEIPGRPAGCARLALAADAHALSGGDPGRNLHRQLAFLLHPAQALARRTRLGNDRSRSAALPAGSRHGEEALLVAQLSAALALRAGRRFRTLGGARSVARLARLVAWDLDAGFGTRGGFLERDFEVVAKVGATLGTSAPAAAEDIAESEDVAKAAKDVLEPREHRRIEAAGRGAAQAGVAEAVVHMPLVGIGEHRVRLGRFLELVFGRLVSRIPVGMVA